MDVAGEPVADPWQSGDCVEFWTGNFAEGVEEYVVSCVDEQVAKRLSKSVCSYRCLELWCFGLTKIIERAK